MNRKPLIKNEIGHTERVGIPPSALSQKEGAGGKLELERKAGKSCKNKDLKHLGLRNFIFDKVSGREYSCAYCGNIFRARHSFQRFCSGRCRRKGEAWERYKEHEACVRCGYKIEDRPFWQIYCDSCKQKNLAEKAERSKKRNRINYRKRMLNAEQRASERAARKAWREAHPNYHKEWLNAHPEKRQEYRRRHRRKHRHILRQKMSKANRDLVSLQNMASVLEVLKF